jgi:hypothetical protein
MAIPELALGQVSVQTVPVHERTTGGANIVY